MEHQDALREMSVEKYLLGELSGASRDVFEEHLFQCQECAADLTSAVTFAEAARLDLAADVPERARVREKSRKWGSSWADWLRPQWLAPAFAACLVALSYLSFFRVPELQQQLAQAEKPQVLNNLILAEGTMRGGGTPQVGAAEKRAFLLSVDLPQTTLAYASYVCSLYSPSGALVWKETVPASPVRDTLQISVPAVSTQPGENTLLIQGSRQNAAAGATLDDLARHKFVFQLQK